MDSDIQSLKTLSAGRIDAVLGDIDSTVSALKQLKLLDQVYFTPDQSLYAYDSVPTMVRRINNTFKRADEIQWKNIADGNWEEELKKGGFL